MIETVDIVYDALYWMQKTYGKRMAKLLQAGGCPAHNATCSYLRAGICVKDEPKLEYDREGKLGCWSCDDRAD